VKGREETKGKKISKKKRAKGAPAKKVKGANSKGKKATIPRSKARRKK
jgi:hypothetical protein